MAESTAKEGEKKAEGSASDKSSARTNLLLMIIIGVLAVVVIGGGAAMFMLYRNVAHVSAMTQASEEVGEDEGQSEAQAAPREVEKKKPDKKTDKKKKEEGPKAPAIYVTLEPPFVVNFPAGKSAKFLQISMEIMTRDPPTAQLLKDNNPLLRNDVLMLFGAQQYEVIATPEGREALRQQTLEAVRGVVKKEGGKPAEVEAVYFTSFVMQ